MTLFAVEEVNYNKSQLFPCSPNIGIHLSTVYTSNHTLASMTEEANEELERFRRQWQEEVTARTKAGSSIQHIGPRPEARHISNAKLAHSTRAPPAPSIVYDSKTDAEVEALEGHDPAAYHDLEDKDERRRLGDYGAGVHPGNDLMNEPQSALEHYEKAVERENMGSLGDSLIHYRKAYRVGVPFHRTAPWAH